MIKRQDYSQRSTTEFVTALAADSYSYLSTNSSIHIVTYYGWVTNVALYVSLVTKLSELNMSSGITAIGNDTFVFMRSNDNTIRYKQCATI